MSSRRTGEPPAPAMPFPRCAAAHSCAQACEGLVDDLVAVGYALPTVYLLRAGRLRCQAARGYFQVVDGFPPGSGVIGGVAASGVGVHYDDVQARPEFIAAIPGLVAEAAAPVRCRGELVGVVNVESTGPLPMSTLAVLERAAEALGRRLDELGGLPEEPPAERLAEAAVRIAAARDVDDIERLVVEAASSLSGLSSAAVVQLEAAPYAVTTAGGPLAARLAALRHEDLEVLASWVSAGTSSHFPGGLPVTSGYSFLTTAELGTLSVHPLVLNGTVNGLLVVGDGALVPCSPAVVTSLEMLAGQAAAQLGMARAFEATRRRAERDDLTGLGNRTRFRLALEAALAATAESGHQVAVLLMDLDDFKLINDSLGHGRGDELLVEVADRLRTGILRAGDEVCRLGGDEFAVVLPDTTQSSAVALADRLLDLMSENVGLGYADVPVTASIGIVVSSQGPDTAERMLKAADLAMYDAKARGKGGYALYEPALETLALDRLGLESDLRRAIREGGLTLAYQPIVDLVSARMTGVEALVRWTHPDRGAVSPEDFIPLAEETGLILPLGDLVLELACAQVRRWDEAGGDPRMKVSVNVSTRQLEHRGLLSALDRCLGTGLHPSRLVLEVTETALTVDSHRAEATLTAIRDRGVHIAVDDFGTGYSSLARLRTAPVSRLKIDQAFIREIHDVDTDAPIVDATMAMARGLGLGVVAEGVETVAQLSYLQAVGCPQAQGFLLARPLPPAEVLALMHGPLPWQHLFTSQRPGQLPSSSRSGSLVELAVATDVDLAGLVRPMLDELLTMTALPTVYLTRVDLSADQQRCLFSASRPGTPSLFPEGMQIAWTDSTCRRALSDGLRRTPDAQAAFRDTDVPVKLGQRGLAVEPVLDADGRLFGTLCAASGERQAPTEADSATLSMMSRLITEKLRHVLPPDRGEPAPVSLDPAAELNRSLLLARRQAGAERWESAHLRRLQETGTRPDDDLVWEAYNQQRQLSASDLGVSGRRVVVADDSELMRAMVVAHVDAHSLLRLTAEADSGATAIGTTIADQPDILVLDYELGDMSADDVVTQVRAFAPGTRILLHSSRSDVHLLGQRLDVDRAVYKGDGAGRLVEALEALSD